MSIEENTKFKLKTKKELVKPPLYKVIFYNDDQTTFEFVINILIAIFNKNESDALIITNNIHQKGSAVVAIYTQEIALSKKQIVDYNAKMFQYPLVCEIEKE